jgi:glucose/arabinose dehydrogenase
MITNRRFSCYLVLIGLCVLVAACSPVASPTSPPHSTISPSTPLARTTLVVTSSPSATPTLKTMPTPTYTTGLPETAQAGHVTPTAPVVNPTWTPSVEPLPTTTSTPTPPQPTFPPSIALEPALTGFQAPVYVTHVGEDPSGASRLFVVEKGGRIYLVENSVVQPTPFLDITDRVGSEGSEQGLLSVAFPPDFTASGLFYVDYTDLRGDTVVARYRLLAGDVRQADPNTEQKILQIEQPASNHNGGQLQFGPDGYLYIGMGDGGRAGDPWGNAQNPDVLLGKLLRISVPGTETYTVPDDNPFLGRPDARPEIWALGVRNPWRFAFDRATGDLYIADVGQNQYEEVDFQSAASPGGENYGWDLMEANHCFEPPVGCDTSGLVLPVAEYDHTQGCSITGGYVYRGTRYPQMAGVYFFSDFCSGNIWGLRRESSGEWKMALLLNTGVSISSFGEDAAGEIYVVGYRDGIIYHLVASP